MKRNGKIQRLRLNTTIALSISSLILAACTTKVPPPAIQYDKESFKPAAIEADPPKPVTIVRIPEPLPLPGQLQPMSSTGLSETPAPTARVDAANTAALQEPTTHGYINAAMSRERSTGSMRRRSG
jgi:hypothetical protein